MNHSSQNIKIPLLAFCGGGRGLREPSSGVPGTGQLQLASRHPALSYISRPQTSQRSGRYTRCWILHKSCEMSVSRAAASRLARQHSPDTHLSRLAVLLSWTAIEGRGRKIHLLFCILTDMIPASPVRYQYKAINRTLR